jgi:hypothetical protein
VSPGEITIRRVDPVAGRDRILAVLGRNLPTAAVAARLDWLYLANPDGAALVWLAEDAEGTPVGTSVAHPRRMRVQGTVVRALNLGDFALDRSYRSLGPGLRLLHATLEPVRQAEYAFSYDFASRSMQAVYQRMRGVDLGGTEYWTRPLARSWRPWPLLKTALGRVVRRAGMAGLDLDVEPLVGAFGKEFDALDARLSALSPVQGVRDAAYLNWRYLEHTMWRHDVLCARRRGSLVGYAVLRAGADGRVTLLDLYAEAQGGARQRLATEAVEWARAGHAHTLRIEVLARCPTARMARAAGFARQGEGVGPIPFFPADSPYATTLKGADNWWIVGGDRDI